MRVSLLVVAALLGPMGFVAGCTRPIPLDGGGPLDAAVEVALGDAPAIPDAGTPDAPDSPRDAPIVSCGDGRTEGAELCDDGNREDEIDCAYGIPTCAACSSDCSTVLDLIGPVCGDGATNGPEVCDDGNTADEAACAYGTPTCSACSATCSATLSLIGPYCGDRTINGMEACEVGQTQCRVNPILCGLRETRTCGATCQWGAWAGGGCGTCP